MAFPIYLPDGRCQGELRAVTARLILDRITEEDRRCRLLGQTLDPEDWAAIVALVEEFDADDEDRRCSVCEAECHECSDGKCVLPPTPPEPERRCPVCGVCCAECGG